MKHYKVGVIGYFATGKSKAGGQEAKTCTIDRALKEKYGNLNILDVDTTDWKRKPIQLFCGLILMMFQCDNIVMLPAHNSLKVFLPIIVWLNKLLHRKVFYSVVGGWLSQILKRNKNFLKKCRELSCIFVETKSMETELKELGLNNVAVIPNFKFLTPLKPEDLNRNYKEPYRICTFSRVMKEKGIEDIIEAVKRINSEAGKTLFELDIIGKIDDCYVEEFSYIQKSFPDFIRYKGMVEPDESIETIKDYYALIFPTHYYTEGVPGTLIDACMAGVPVISALWGNYKDVFVENVTGWGYEFNNIEALIQTLKRAADEKSLFLKMKTSTLFEAKKYLPENNIETITSYFT